MNLEQELLDKVRSLPPSKRQEVLDFAEFLAQQRQRDSDDPYARLDEADPGDLEPEEKAKLDAAITNAWKSYEAGDETVPADEVVAKLRAKA